MSRNAQKGNVSEREDISFNIRFITIYLGRQIYLNALSIEMCDSKYLVKKIFVYCGDAHFEL